MMCAGFPSVSDQWFMNMAFFIYLFYFIVEEVAGRHFWKVGPILRKDGVGVNNLFCFCVLWDFYALCVCIPAPNGTQLQHSSGLLCWMFSFKRIRMDNRCVDSQTVGQDSSSQNCWKVLGLSRRASSHHQHLSHRKEKSGQFESLRLVMKKHNVYGHYRTSREQLSSG